MIRINLLPIRQFKRKEGAKRAVLLYILIIAGLIGLLGFFQFGNEVMARSLKVENADLAAIEAELKKKVALVDEMEKKKDSLEEKLKIIKDLEEARRGPVRVLDQISQWIPPQRAWLTSLEKKGSSLTLEGMALDNETIAEFMDKLKESERFGGVTLLFSTEKIENGARFKNFTITCGILAPGPKNPETNDADS